MYAGRLIFDGKTEESVSLRCMLKKLRVFVIDRPAEFNMVIDKLKFGRFDFTTVPLNNTEETDLGSENHYLIKNYI